MHIMDAAFNLRGQRVRFEAQRFMGQHLVEREKVARANARNFFSAAFFP